MKKVHRGTRRLLNLQINIVANEDCAANGRGLSRAAKRRRRCRIVASRWSQWHAVNVSSALQVPTEHDFGLQYDPTGADAECKWEVFCKEHGALLGERAALKAEHAFMGKELAVTRARENILQMEVNMLRKFPKLGSEPPRIDPFFCKRVLKKSPSDESSASCSTRRLEEDPPVVRSDGNEGGQLVALVPSGATNPICTLHSDSPVLPEARPPRQAPRAFQVLLDQLFC